jgi:hypothetical protein
MCRTTNGRRSPRASRIGASPHLPPRRSLLAESRRRAAPSPDRPSVVTLAPEPRIHGASRHAHQDRPNSTRARAIPRSRLSEDRRSGLEFGRIGLSGRGGGIRSGMNSGVRAGAGPRGRGRGRSAVGGGGGVAVETGRKEMAIWGEIWRREMVIWSTSGRDGEGRSEMGKEEDGCGRRRERERGKRQGHFRHSPARSPARRSPVQWLCGRESIQCKL